MKQKLIFYYKSIYTQKSYFYAEEKNFSLKQIKMLCYNRPILRSVFADVLMFKHELP